MAELAEDVITDILTRLPVKSLLRFRCISKHFLALIDGPHFIKRHLNRSLLTKTNHKLILRGRDFFAPVSHARFYSVDLNTLDQALQLNRYHYETEIVGSDNGLLCLCKGNRDIVFWNFATRRYRKIPDTEIEFSGPGAVSSVYGFGYDSLSDDYKLLRLVQFYGNDPDSFSSEAKVYSLRSNSWQRIQDFPYYHCHGGAYGELVCGALHWVVSRKRHSDRTTFIAAFDLATNDYRLLDHPKFLEEQPFNVGKLEGRLCVLWYKYFEQVDVWVMKDYGVKESWNLLFSVSQSGNIGSLLSVVPLAYSKNGTEIMLFKDDRKLVWYSPKEGTVKTLNIYGCPENFLLPEVCVESLVPLSEKAKVYAKKRVGGAKEKLIVKKRRDALSSQGSS